MGTYTKEELEGRRLLRLYTANHTGYGIRINYFLSHIMKNLSILKETESHQRFMREALHMLDRSKHFGNRFYDKKESPDDDLEHLRYLPRGIGYTGNLANMTVNQTREQRFHMFAFAGTEDYDEGTPHYYEDERLGTAAEFSQECKTMEQVFNDLLRKPEVVKYLEAVERNIAAAAQAQEQQKQQAGRSR